MKLFAYILIGLSSFFIASTAFAGDASAGKTKAAICASCHGADGIAIAPSYPNLAGQNEAYLVSALKAYKEKKRNGGLAAIMQMQAAGLSDEDIDNIAAYYSSLK